MPPQKRKEFAYGRGFFLQRFLLLAAFAVLFLSVLGLQFQAPPAWIAGFTVLFVPYILIWGVSPLLTNHWLTATRLILRQGWYFRAVFPLREIESVDRFEGNAPLGVRAPIGRRRLFVAGSKIGLVSVKLREPRRFWAVLGATADEIVFDVDSPQSFLDAFGARMESLAPVQAERPYPYLRA